MTMKTILPGDTVFVIDKYMNTIRQSVAKQIFPDGVLLCDRMMRTYWHEIFATREEAKAGIVARAEQQVNTATQELENARIRLAKVRKKFPAKKQVQL